MVYSTLRLPFLVWGISLGLIMTNCQKAYNQTSEPIYPTTIKSSENGIDKIVLKCDRGLIVITFYASNIVHFVYYPSDKQINLSGFGCYPSIVHVDPKITDVKGVIRVKSSDVEVRITKASSKIEYLDNKGNVFLHGSTFLCSPIVDKNTYELKTTFAALNGEDYYGLGLLPGEWLNHKGKKVTLMPDSVDASGFLNGVPFMVTNKNYGFVFDNTSKITVEPGVEGITSWSAESGDAISYYVIYSSTVDGIYTGYRTLTGSTPLPSRSSFGYFQGRQPFKGQTEILKVARKYRDKGYPCDNLILGTTNWKVPGDMDWEPKNWPNPMAMNQNLTEKHFRTSIFCGFAFNKESKNFVIIKKNNWATKSDVRSAYKETSKSKPGAILDFTSLDATKWYWNLVYGNYAKKGFSGWWLDENRTGSDPLHENANLLSEGFFRRCRNLPILRSLIFSQDAYLGAQQWGSVFTSIDYKPDWVTYKQQISVGLNFCASGFPFWASNIGGYLSVKENAKRSEDIQRILIGCDTCMGITKRMKDYVELYVRWFQFGAFCPGFLSYGAREQNEVWSYGGEAEIILAKYLKLRYRLLPYIYSLAFQSHQTGAPFMRGLFMDFSSDSKVAGVSDEYMFGPAFLIAPVVKQGMESRDVYFPARSDWYDYWTYKKMKGGQMITCDAPIDKIPIFLKAGSIIPYGPEIQYASEKSDKPLEIRIFPGADGKFELYEDENDNYNYEEGKYSVIPFTWNDKKQTLTIGERRGDFEGMLTERTFTILNGADYTKASETVNYTGKSVVVKMK